MEKKTFDGLIQGMREMQAMERGETVPGARIHDLKRNSATYADRRRKAGWRRVAVWVPEDRVDDLRAFVDDLGKERMPGKTAHHLDSRWKPQGKSAPTSALDDLLAGMKPETFHEPVDFGGPVGKEDL